MALLLCSYCPAPVRALTSLHAPHRRQCRRQRPQQSPVQFQCPLFPSGPPRSRAVQLRQSPISPPSPSSTALGGTAASATVAATAATTQTSRQFLTGFLTGGLFFSALILTIMTFSLLGVENVRRVLDVRSLVFGRVWNTFFEGLGAARVTLRSVRRTGNNGDGTSVKWNWSGALKVLREKLGETRLAIAAALEAIRLDAGLYAAAVGKPGLIALQYLVNHLTPKFFAATLEDTLRESLSKIEDKNVRKVDLVEFHVGNKAPELLDARAYELGEEAMAFDIDVRWDSELVAKMMVTTDYITLPISVRNLSFVGVVRVVLAPLTPDPPGFGAALVSLPTDPTLGLDVRMAGGEISRLPWLKNEIMSTIQRGVADEYLWPRRVVIPSPAKPSKAPETMLSRDELEELKTSDPLLRAERKLAETPAYKENLEKTRSAPDGESLQMDILLKEADCDEEEEVCLIDSWSSSDYDAPAPDDDDGELNGLGQKNDSAASEQGVWKPVVEVPRPRSSKQKPSEDDGEIQGGGSSRRKKRPFESIWRQPLKSVRKGFSPIDIIWANGEEEEQKEQKGQHQNSTLPLERVWKPALDFAGKAYHENVEKHVTRIVSPPDNKHSLRMDVIVEDEDCGEEDDDEPCIIDDSSWSSSSDHGHHHEAIDEEQELLFESSWRGAFDTISNSRPITRLKKARTRKNT